MWIEDKIERRVHQVSPGIFANWKLHFDYAPSHTCFVVNNYLARNGIATLPANPCSPNLYPDGHSPVSLMRTVVKIHSHVIIAEIKRALSAFHKRTSRAPCMDNSLREVLFWRNLIIFEITEK